MKIIVEKEAKYLLDESEFIKLKQYLDNKYNKQNYVEQVNYYIDTDDHKFLKRNITLRLRCKNEQYELTLKKPQNDSNISHVKVKQEITINLKHNVAENLILNNDFTKYKLLLKPLFNEIGENINLSDISIIGNLKTKRYYYLIDGIDEPINLDINYYLNTKDYEIESESDNIENSQSTLLDLFKYIDIKPLMECNSKHSRFMQQYTDLL